MRIVNLELLLSLVLVGFVFPATAQEAKYHHVHLTATDPVEAAHWYAENLGGVIPESAPRGDRAAFGDVAFVFFKKTAGFSGSETALGAILGLRCGVRWQIPCLHVVPEQSV